MNKYHHKESDVSCEDFNSTINMQIMHKPSIPMNSHMNVDFTNLFSIKRHVFFIFCDEKNFDFFMNI